MKINKPLLIFGIFVLFTIPYSLSASKKTPSSECRNLFTKPQITELKGGIFKEAVPAREEISDYYAPNPAKRKEAYVPMFIPTRPPAKEPSPKEESDKKEPNPDKNEPNPDKNLGPKHPHITELRGTIFKEAQPDNKIIPRHFAPFRAP